MATATTKTKAKAPKKTPVVVMETHDGVYESTHDVATPAELLSLFFDYLREGKDPEPWVQTKDGDLIRWQDVRKIRWATS